MIPIHQLLDRIQWDEAFGQGEFLIGYADRMADGIVRVPLEELRLEEGNRFSFQVVDVEGELRTIPFHRVREVYRDGIVIWQRSA